ncbi:hypothetical protein MMC17_006307 [Xylographa soralifera]|nr:hypothetical protein [Xylographa soralifera]
MAFDIILLFLPLWPVMKLQMPMQKRIGVVAMFMLGAMASIVAAYKLAIFVTQMSRFDDINPAWATYQMSMLIPPQFDEYGVTFWIPSQIEPTVALIGTSLPALRLLLSDPDGTSTGRSKLIGNSSDKGRHSESRGSRIRQARPGLESQLPLRSEYVELNDCKSFMK